MEYTQDEPGLTGITDATNLDEAVEAGKLSPEMAAAWRLRWRPVSTMSQS
jgi:hypothetical protein